VFPLLTNTHQSDWVGWSWLIYIERDTQTHTPNVCICIQVCMDMYTHIHVKVFIKRLSKEGLLRAMFIR